MRFCILVHCEGKQNSLLLAIHSIFAINYHEMCRTCEVSHYFFIHFFHLWIIISHVVHCLVIQLVLRFQRDEWMINAKSHGFNWKSIFTFKINTSIFYTIHCYPPITVVHSLNFDDKSRRNVNKMKQNEE